MRRSRLAEGEFRNPMQDQVAGRSALDVCRKHAISDWTRENAGPLVAKSGGLSCGRRCG